MTIVQTCALPISTVGQQGDRFAVVVHRGPAARALCQVVLDQGALVVVDGVERVGAQQVLHLVGGHVRTPDSARPARRRLSPERILVFTVPSGTSSISATRR